MIPDDERKCAECEGPVHAHGTYFCVQFENQPQEVWKDFCSWEHIVAWVGRGEPDWDAEATLFEPTRWWVQVGCIAVLVLALTIFTLGLISLARLIF